MFGDNAGVARTKNEHIDTIRHFPRIIRENVFYEKPVIEQEQERGQEGNENYRIGNEVVKDIVVVNQVN
jgi:hypothetical protein